MSPEPDDGDTSTHGGADALQLVLEVNEVEVDAAEVDVIDQEDVPSVKVGADPDAGWLTVTVADAAGLPNVVVNVTVAERAAPVVFGCAVKVSGRLPSEGLVGPAVTKPNPPAALAVTQEALDEACQPVFDVGVAHVESPSAAGAQNKWVTEAEVFWFQTCSTGELAAALYPVTT
ncbi:MAG: hypothetical protein FWD74_12420 [Actinomycetia bacterium]|nr:hypothetical protein [Actinomycetes bacterium]